MKWSAAACVVLTLAVAACAGRAVAKERSQGRSGAAPRSPAGQPLVSGAFAYSSPSQPAGESEPESAAASEDPLTRNGLRSPLCGLASAEMPESVAADCRTSGFVAAAAPSEDYSFDTNIDTTLGISIDALLQDYLVRPIWMGLVWLVHGLLVALEWSYSLNLLHGPLAGNLGSLLRAAGDQFTDPWLACLLALAGVLVAYHGIVRREVAQTLGDASAMLAMIAAAMVVIADPAGTVGALSEWANEASVGSVGAIAEGSSSRPYASLAASMEQLYTTTIEAPWCFLEFGNVSWCATPSRLDSRLHAVAMRIAARAEAEAKSGQARGVGAETLLRAAQLLRGARTNGAIFLALPANGPLRNSVKDAGSLLYVLCGGGSDARSCRGPTAAEAEFRANSGTLPRIGGVIVIALGVLGMLLLVGFVALRLLEAAILSLLLLVLTPAAALAPTLGEVGRAMFRRWAGRLLGAATAKLLWSVVLAALLSVTRILVELEGIGWLTQWLLLGTLWWGVFLRRHGLLATVSPGYGPTSGRGHSRSHRLTEDAAVAFGWTAARGAHRHYERVKRERKADALERAAQRKQEEEKQVREPQGQERQEGALQRPGHTLPGGESPQGNSKRLADGREGTHTPPTGGSPQGDAERFANGPGGTPENEPMPARPEPSVHDPARRTAAAPKADGDAQEVSLTAPARANDAAAVRARLARLRRAHAVAVLEGQRRRAVSLKLRIERVEQRLGATGGASAESAPFTAERRTRGGDTDAKTMRTQIDREIGARRQSQPQLLHPIMRDAFEVAQRRKRQLGYGKQADD